MIFQFATEVKFDFNFFDWGVPAAPAGQVDLPAGGVRSATPGPAGFAGTSKICEIKVPVHPFRIEIQAASEQPIPFQKVWRTSPHLFAVPPEQLGFHFGRCPALACTPAPNGRGCL